MRRATPRAEAAPSELDASRLDREAWLDSRPPEDSTFLSRQARRMAAADAGGFQRLYRAFVAARAALGLALAGAELLAAGFGGGQRGTLLISLLYLLLAGAAWLLPRRWTGPVIESGVRLRYRAWLATIGLDLLAFGALHHLTRSDFNTAALLVLPCLMAGVLTPRLHALGVAAAASLLLLGEALRLDGLGDYLALSRAGLAGGGLFLVTLLAHEVARRLAREERTARGSLELARQQAQLNRLVLADMDVGVLVVDARGRVRTANPAARALLPVLDVFLGPDGDPVLPPALAQALARARAEGDWPDAGRDVVLSDALGERGIERGSPTALRLRIRLGRDRDRPGGEDHVLLFIEDLRVVQARLRDEKLAAMGRVTAGIAHEIRNPLAAITQANALLAEGAEGPQRARLIAMVADNAARLKRIVDDVMEVAAGGPEPAPPPLEAVALLGEAASGWLQAQGLPEGPDSPLRLQLPPGPLWLRFESDHLRRVLLNLLDNALRHGSHSPGAVQLLLVGIGPQWAEITVASDGPPIPPEVEAHLFEPFYSTRSRGTGLGLYICQELCGRYGARIDFLPGAEGARHSKLFRVRLRRLPPPLAPRPAADPRP